MNTLTKEITMFNALIAHVQGTGVLWHLAPVSARDSIQANGILPGTHSDVVWLYVDKDYTPSDYDLARGTAGSDGHYTYRTSLDLWAVQATPEVLASMQLDTHLQDVAPYSAVVVPCVSLPATLHTPCHRRAGSSTRDPINRPVSAYKESINQIYQQKEGKAMKAMSFKKGDLVTIRLKGKPTVSAREYVIVDVISAMSASFRGEYEAKAIGSDVSEYFTVWNDSYDDSAINQLGYEVKIQDTDDFNFDNSSNNK